MLGSRAVVDDKQLTIACREIPRINYWSQLKSKSSGPWFAAENQFYEKRIERLK